MKHHSRKNKTKTKKTHAVLQQIHLLTRKNKQANNCRAVPQPVRIGDAIEKTEHQAEINHGHFSLFPSLYFSVGDDKLISIPILDQDVIPDNLQSVPWSGDRVWMVFVRVGCMASRPSHPPLWMAQHWRQLHVWRKPKTASDNGGWEGRKPVHRTPTSNTHTWSGTLFKFSVMRSWSCMGIGN